MFSVKRKRRESARAQPQRRHQKKIYSSCKYECCYEYYTSCYNYLTIIFGCSGNLEQLSLESTLLDDQEAQLKNYSYCKTKCCHEYYTNNYNDFIIL